MLNLDLFQLILLIKTILAIILKKMLFNIWLIMKCWINTFNVLANKILILSKLLLKNHLKFYFTLIYVFKKKAFNSP